MHAFLKSERKGKAIRYYFPNLVEKKWIFGVSSNLIARQTCLRDARRRYHLVKPYLKNPIP